MTGGPPGDRFVLDGFEPAYLRLAAAGALWSRVELAVGALTACRICPRRCGADRSTSASGTCGTGRQAVIASAFAHHGEEGCLSGTRGSGTIFFSQCGLRCAFCQNWDISQQDVGRACTAGEVARLMLALEAQGCHNVNLVTPSHVVPQVIEAIAAAVPMGLRVPVVYNTSGYDEVGSLRMLEGLVDVYMPDFKFWSPATARRLASAEDYPDRARDAIREMHRQVGVLKLGRDGLAKRGVLVRHLVMPGQEDEAAAIFEWIASELSPDTYVNVMGQYRPDCHVGEPDSAGRPRFAEIARRPTSAEMSRALAEARRAGLWRLDPSP